MTDFHHKAFQLSGDLAVHVPAEALCILGQHFHMGPSLWWRVSAAATYPELREVLRLCLLGRAAVAHLESKAMVPFAHYTDDRTKVAR